MSEVIVDETELTEQIDILKKDIVQSIKRFDPSKKIKIQEKQKI